MAKALVLVESPNKRGKIQWLLDKLHESGHVKDKCVVLSTIGHVYDLPAKELGVNEVTFELKTVQTKADVLKRIKAAALGLGGPIYLATDPDREGEAIGFYVQEFLKRAGVKGPYHRVEFHEITLAAVKQAFSSPRQVDMNRVQAQQARRALDRLCGYKISPFLWRELGSYKLSAGRVQSYALDMLVSNSLERRNFEPKEQWYAVLHLSDGKRARSQAFDSVKDAEALTGCIDKLKRHYKKTSEEQNPYPPFTTSRLLQEAGRRWGYSSQAVMAACQDLFAAGRITYHRTDSTTISWSAVGMMRKELTKYKFDLSKKPRTYSGQKGKHSQGAHECIRPSHVDARPISTGKIAEAKGSRVANKELVYRLVYARAMATQLKPALWSKQSLTFDTGKEGGPVWNFNGQTLKRRGWYDIDWPLLGESDTKLNKNAKPVKITIESDLTQPPPPFTESYIIQRMEKDGVGRPSTYASVIGALQRHQYISRQGRVLLPTPIGEAVSVYMRSAFPQLLDPKFTAHMEERLDGIEKGTKKYVRTLHRYNRWIDRTLRRQPKKRFTVDVRCKSCKLVMLQMKFPWKGGVPYLQCRNCKANFSIDFTADGTVCIFKDKKYRGECVLCHKEKLVKRQSKFGFYIECQNPKCGAVQKGAATVTKEERLARNKIREAEEKKRLAKEAKLEKEGKAKPRRRWQSWRCA